MKRLLLLVCILIPHAAYAQNYVLQVSSISPATGAPYKLVSGTISISTRLEQPNSSNRPARTFVHEASVSGTVVATLLGQPATFDIDTTLVPDGVHYLTFNEGEPDIWPNPVILIVDNVPGVDSLGQAPVCGYRQNLGGTEPGSKVSPYCMTVSYPPAPPIGHPFPAGQARPYQVIPARAEFQVEHVLPNQGLFDNHYRWWKSVHGELYVADYSYLINQNFESAKDQVDRRPLSDGYRGSAYVSACINGAVHPVTGELYFVECGFKHGRLGKISLDGTVTTLAGSRLKAGVVPYHQEDTSAPFDGQFELVGDWSAYPPGRFAMPMDLDFDPSDPTKLYVADSYNHRIALADLATYPVRISPVAGGVLGYADGTSPQFDLPMSLSVGNGGIYVADRNNFAVRFFNLSSGSTSTIYTLAHKPMVVRMAGHGTPLEHFYALEITTGQIWHYNTNTESLTVAATSPKIKPWIWMDVDRDCSAGPCNQIFLAYTEAMDSAVRFDVSTGLWSTLAGGAGLFWEQRADGANSGHYPWMIAVGKDGSIWTNGTGTFGVQRIRSASSLSEPPVNQTFTEESKVKRGRILWRYGCGNGCEWASVPSYSMTHGSQGWSLLGFPSAEDLADLSDADLDAALLNGAGTGIPRSFSPLELSDLRYFLRNVSSYAVRGLALATQPPPPPPPPPDPVCGNGLVEIGEQCDDGNVTSGDSCSCICTLEPTCP